MKKLFAVFAALLLTATLWAQSPEKMSYQAVIRNSSNALVTNAQIGMQINIRQGSPTGTIVYTETQTPTTNANGLVSIEIGGGAGFNTIDWSNGTYFIETNTAVVPPLTNYTISGTSQLLSVAYALHAKAADMITGTITEADPLWTASPSFGITNTNISNLNTAFGWGNHATAGYLTSFTETDPLWSVSPSFGITGSSISNWNTAFGWGNHATAGYLTSFTETDPLYTSKFDITGATNGDILKFDGIKFIKFTPNYLTSEIDGSITNEIQTLSINGNDLTISGTGRNTVTLPSADGSETKVTAGTNVTVSGSGTTARPYVVNATGNPTLTIGQSYQGGIIFWLDATGQHGLIAATADQSTGIQWYNGTFRNTGTTGDGLYAGEMNTAIILATQMADNQTGDFAAKVCADYSVSVGGVTYGDWYLPSKYELNLLYQQKTAVGGFGSDYYWSSAEYDFHNAWYQYFDDGSQFYYFKYYPRKVRAVRAF
ncbi:MAG: DUF1566 domain-containing protein [Bacteroidales bacterium]